MTARQTASRPRQNVSRAWRGAYSRTLEDRFAWHWQHVQHGPPFVREYLFHPSRKWRFDFAWPAQKVALEIEGGTWSRGAHGRGQGIARDCEKGNEAAALGWLVFRLTSDMIRSDVDRWAKLIAATIAGRS